MRLAKLLAVVGLLGVDHVKWVGRVIRWTLRRSLYFISRHHRSRSSAIGNALTESKEASALADMAYRAEVSDGTRPTVFVTVSPPVITRTVTIPTEAVSCSVSLNTTPTVSQLSEDIKTVLAATFTSYVTSTRVISFSSIVLTTSTISIQDSELPNPAQGQAPASIGHDSEPTMIDQGPYYFTENDGTTVWLNGKTPPGGQSFITSSTVFTVQPIPADSFTSNEGTLLSTSYSTIFLYSVSTVYQTGSVTKTIPTLSTLSKTLFELGSSGWNTTSALQLKEKLVASEIGLLNRIRQQTGGQNSAACQSTSKNSLPASSLSSNVTRDLKARQVGSVISATVDGVVVSWINNYDGAPPLTSLLPAAYASDERTGEDVLESGKFWDLNRRDNRC